VHDVRHVMPDEGIVCLDNGMYKIWFARNYRTHVANTLLLDSLSTRTSGAFPAISAPLMAPIEMPVGLKIGLGQRLVDSSLIGAERTATLKQERNALEGRTRSGPVRLAAIDGARERFGHLTALSGERSRLIRPALTELPPRASPSG
jgi:hypothetical protein